MSRSTVDRKLYRWDIAMPDGVHVTYGLICQLAKEHGDGRALSLRCRELAELRGCCERTMFYHLRALRELGLIRSRPSAAQLELLDPLRPADGGGGAAPSRSSDAKSRRGAREGRRRPAAADCSETASDRRAVDTGVRAVVTDDCAVVMDDRDVVTDCSLTARDGYGAAADCGDTAADGRAAATDRHDAATDRHGAAVDRYGAATDRHDAATDRHDAATDRHDAAVDCSETANDRRAAAVDCVEAATGCSDAARNEAKIEISQDRAEIGLTSANLRPLSIVEAAEAAARSFPDLANKNKLLAAELGAEEIHPAAAPAWKHCRMRAASRRHQFGRAAAPAPAAGDGDGADSPSS